MKYDPKGNRLKHDIKPGHVILQTWGSMKARPWLVLWVDDESVCVAPFTNQGGYVGVIETGHAKRPYVGAWAMVQPLWMAACREPLARVGREERAALRRALLERLDLFDEEGLNSGT